MIERVDPATVTVTIYHVCSQGASGSALGPYERVSYWWAEPGRMRVAGNGSHRDQVEVEEAVITALGGASADRVRAAQDFAAEAIE